MKKSYTEKQLFFVSSKHYLIVQKLKYLSKNKCILNNIYFNSDDGTNVNEVSFIIMHHV